MPGICKTPRPMTCVPGKQDSTVTVAVRKFTGCLLVTTLCWNFQNLCSAGWLSTRQIAPPHSPWLLCWAGSGCKQPNSFELAGIQDAFDLTKLTFLWLISSSPSLASLSLSHYCFLNRARLSRVTPVKLSKLESPRPMYVSAFPVFPGLINAPAFNTLPSLRISARESTVGFPTLIFSYKLEIMMAFNYPTIPPSIPRWYLIGLVSWITQARLRLSFVSRDENPMLRKK